jgi:MFS transporter, FHS family, glucose/mannose:H+ symporter
VHFRGHLQVPQNTQSLQEYLPNLEVAAALCSQFQKRYNTWVPSTHIPPPEIMQASASRKALGGLFISGLLMSFPGAILPAWGYHLRSDFSTTGYFFLGMNLGVLASLWIALILLPRRGTNFVLSIACALAAGAMGYLALFSPPAPDWTRIIGFFIIGIAAGLLNTAVFHAISTIYQINSAATINLAGTFFGVGCLSTSLFIAFTFNAYTVASRLILFAVIPAIFSIAFARARVAIDAPIRHRAWQQVARDFRNPLAILFSLLLFFQFGNEWSIAGWLPLFLIHRIGVSPVTALVLLSVYWLALLLGRIVCQAILPSVGHGKLLMTNVVTAMLGCITLVLTNNEFGATMGILLVGFGFSIIYPLVVEKIGARFPNYHPGYFNGIFSFALTGGMLAPWLLGYLADWSGVEIVMALPMAGTCAVFMLLVAIMVESKLSGRGSLQPEDHRS